MKRVQHALEAPASGELAHWIEEVGGAAAVTALAGLIEGAAAFIVDRERTIRHWNAAAERLLWFRAQEVLGQHCHRWNATALRSRVCARRFDID